MAQHTGVALRAGSLAELAYRTGARNEKDRIARDIHDSIAQLFAVIGLQCAAASMSARETGGQAVDYVNHIQEIASEGLRQTRRLIRSLSEQDQVPRDLEAVIGQVLHRFCDGMNLHHECQFKGKPPELGQDCVRQLESILTEAVSNVLQHAKASRLVVKTQRMKGHYIIRVTDNGTGLAAAEHSDGHGQKNMRLRAKQIGATLDVDSFEEIGTRLTLSMPLSPGRSWSSK